MTKVKGTALIGLKSVTICVHDGKTPTVGENLFTLEGKENEGATQTAKVTGLSSDPVKTYGSNVAYHVSNRGVGDVKVEMGLLDVPLALYINALGYGDDDGIYYFGADTVAKNVSILIESNTADGEPVYYGFYKGQLSMDAIDFETFKDKANELATTNVDFAATASSDAATNGRYGAIVYGSDAEKLKKLKGQLKMVAAG